MVETDVENSNIPETIDRNRNDRTDYKNENIKKWKQIIKYENDNKKENS